MRSGSQRASARRTGGEQATIVRSSDAAEPSAAGLPRRLSLAKLAPVAVLVAFMAFYAIWYSLWSLRKFDSFQAPAFDLGIYDQGLWLLSRFKEPFVTVLGLNLFADHTSLILVLFIPLYWIFPHAGTLLVVQALVLAAGAIPVYLLAKMVLRHVWVALIPAAAYLLTPALGWLNLENFHPDSLEVPLLLFALYFIARSRWRPYLAMVILLLMVKEDVPLVLIPLGIYVAVRHHRAMGLATIWLSVVWLVVAIGIIQPALSGAAAGGLDSWRIPFGGVGGLFATLFKRPWEVLGYMFTPEKVKYLFQLLTPVLFLPLLTWRTAVLVPIVAFNLISTFWYQTNLQYHYTSLIIPVLCGAALLALQRFGRLQTRRVLVVGILLATVFSGYLWGPLPRSREPAYDPDPRHPQTVACAEAVALIPDDAIVAAGDKFGSHLTHRQFVYIFPTPFSAAYWGDDSKKGERLAVADEVQWVLDLPSSLPEESVQVFATLPAEGFVTVYDREGVVLLKRETPVEPGGD